MEVPKDGGFFSPNLFFLLLGQVNFFLNVLEVFLFLSDVLINLIGLGGPSVRGPEEEHPPHQETSNPHPSSTQRPSHLYFRTLIEATKLPKKPRTIPPNNIQAIVSGGKKRTGIFSIHACIDGGRKRFPSFFYH